MKKRETSIHHLHHPHSRHPDRSVERKDKDRRDKEHRDRDRDRDRRDRERKRDRSRSRSRSKERHREKERKDKHTSSHRHHEPHPSTLEDNAPLLNSHTNSHDIVTLNPSNDHAQDATNPLDRIVSSTNVPTGQSNSNLAAKPSLSNHSNSQSHNNASSHIPDQVMF